MWRSPIVLLLDDEDEQREAMAQLLRLEGFFVATARTIGDAEELLRRVEVDALVTDYYLVDGIWPDLRSRVRVPRVVIVTSATPVSDPRNRSSCDASFTQPVNAAVIAAGLRLLLRR